MQEGQKIRDYVLEEMIGEGGMGQVWRARHTILDREVAIKAMARHLEADPEFGHRFLQEAQSQARLHHPRIVGVSDFFAEGGEYFLVMPLLSGKSLADRLHEIQGPLPIEEALVIARDVLDALDYAHQQGVIHRDVKPSNILLDGQGHASLTDFGIALSLGRRRVTLTKTSLGTPHYMSPEQIRAPRNVDHRTDVYSFGCVLYEMLTGRPPFSDASDAEDTDFALKEAHVYREPESLRKKNPQVPAWLDAAVLRALAKNPDQRFLGCGEFRRTLDAPSDSPAAVSAAAPGAVRAVKKPGPAPASGRRSPVALVAGIAAIVAVLAAFVLFATRDWRSDEMVAEPPADLTAPQPSAAGPVPEIIESGGRPAAVASEPREAGEEGTEEGEGTGEPEPADPQAETVEPPQSEDIEILVPVETERKTPEPEPITTDLEVRGGVVPPPAEEEEEPVEPLGTDLRPPV